MNPFRKATIKEVAARSGVSTTTVSNFINGHKNVCSPDTAERIREAVSALQYAPSSLTRGLRNLPSTTIGVCLPNPLDVEVDFGFFFYERLWRGILEQSDVENYSLLHFPRSVRDSASTAAFLDGRVDGILMRAHDNKRALHLADAGMPTILLTRSRQIPDGCGAVWADEGMAVRIALDYLLSLGHRRIAHIAGPVGSYPRQAPQISIETDEDGVDIAVQRLTGYSDWMRAHNLWDPALIVFAQSWSASQATQYLLQWRALVSPPTAVLCANDAQAIDLIAAARSLNLRIPEQLAVLGIDNSPEARDCDPPLTSVDVPLDVVGRQSMRTLLQIIHGAAATECRIAVPVTDLIIRRSTAPV